MRLTKTPEEYNATRESRRELPYEAMIASGQRDWSAGERIRVYRTAGGNGKVVGDPDESRAAPDPRDYDVEWYVRLLRETYAARMVRAFSPADYDAVFPHPDQLSLFSPPIEGVTTVLRGEPGDV